KRPVPPRATGSGWSSDTTTAPAASTDTSRRSPRGPDSASWPETRSRAWATVASPPGRTCISSTTRTGTRPSTRCRGCAPTASPTGSPRQNPAPGGAGFFALQGRRSQRRSPMVAGLERAGDHLEVAPMALALGVRALLRARRPAAHVALGGPVPGPVAARGLLRLPQGLGGLLGRLVGGHVPFTAGAHVRPPVPRSTQVGIARHRLGDLARRRDSRHSLLVRRGAPGLLGGGEPRLVEPPARRGQVPRPAHAQVGKPPIRARQPGPEVDRRGHGGEGRSVRPVWAGARLG